jgi:NADH dehydrogenase
MSGPASPQLPAASLGGVVAVTGANGRVGRRLLERLAAARALVRSEAAAAALPDHARDEARLVDWRDPASIPPALEGCEAVVHLIGILKETARARYSEAHETSCAALARACERSGVKRIVYLSILGSDPGEANGCLASKGRAEKILQGRSVPSVVLRVPMVLGPGEIAAHALRAQATARFAFLVRGGATLEQPIDSEDVVSAILGALAGRVEGSAALDLAGPESLSHRALVERAAAVLGTRPRIVPVPLALARVFAAVAERLFAEPPLTTAMLGVLEHDDRIDPGPACARLGLALTPLDETLRRALGAPEGR